MFYICLCAGISGNVTDLSAIQYRNFVTIGGMNGTFKAGVGI
jgi:hypothetical protein